MEIDNWKNRNCRLVRSRGRTVHTFEFNTLPLFKMKARPFVEDHHTCIYPLLPAMPDIDADLLVGVVSELSELYTKDRNTFSDQMSWMSLLLERNKDVDDAVKREIKERIPMFDQLWEESPTVQKMRADYYEKGKGEGQAEGMLQTRQQTLVEFVQARFPVLTELAQRQAQLCKNAEVLHTVTQQLYAAPDVGVAQRLLESLSGV